MQPKILIVDDDRCLLQSISAALLLRGFESVSTLEDELSLVDELDRNDYDILFLDLHMPLRDGLSLLPDIFEVRPDLVVLIITGANDIKSAVSCMKSGAFDYLVKPIDADGLEFSLRQALEVRSLKIENSMLRQEIIGSHDGVPAAFRKIITSDQIMFKLFSYAQTVAVGGNPVLITGETGVGKELFASAIHHASGCKGKFVAVNTAGVDENFFTDSLFGHKRGAFTGADSDFPGLIEEAAEGTLFLDEIGDLSPACQVKLLRLLQEGEYYRIGASTPQRLKARLIFATNCDLRKLQNTGGFRRDLFYRLSTHEVNIPPLRERRGDIKILALQFAREAAQSMGRSLPKIDNEFLTRLLGYAFPGNVRELRAIMEDAVSRSRDRVTSEMLDSKLFVESPCQKDSMLQKHSGNAIIFPEGFPTLKDAEMMLVKEALKLSHGNQTQAAQLLGISQQAVSKRLKKLSPD